MDCGDTITMVPTSVSMPFGRKQKLSHPPFRLGVLKTDPNGVFPDL